MTRLGSVVKQCLDEMGWTDEVRDDEDAGESRMSTPLEVAGQSCRLYVDTDEGNDSISVFLYPPFRVCEDNHVQACVLVNAINYRTRVAHLEISPGDGAIRALVAIDVEGSEPCGLCVNVMLRAVNAILKRWMWALAAVAIAGRAAQDVLDEYERRSAEEQAQPTEQAES